MTNAMLQLTEAESHTWGDDEGEEVGANFRRETRERALLLCADGQTIEILASDGIVLDALTDGDEAS